MASKIYPEFHKLFEEVKTGKELRYTPEEMVEAFEAYIVDLEEHPICMEVTYKKGTKTHGGGMERSEEQGQTRVEKFPASPTISDFCSRWLGKDIRWWSELAKTKDEKKRNKYERVKNLISAYCRKVKLNGAEVGIYNFQIVARELGLVEKQSVEHTGKQIQYVVNSSADIEELKKAANGVGLVE